MAEPMGEPHGDEKPQRVEQIRPRRIDPSGGGDPACWDGFVEDHRDLPPPNAVPDRRATNR